MTSQKRRKDPTQPGSGGTARAHTVDPDSVIVLEAEPPPSQKPRRARRKPPPPLPRNRHRTLEVEVSQIEAEVAAEMKALEALAELLYAPCHAASAYHKLGYRQATLLAAVDGKRTAGEIATRSGLDLDSVQRGLESLCSAGLIKRIR